MAGEGSWHRSRSVAPSSRPHRTWSPTIGAANNNASLKAVLPGASPAAGAACCMLPEGTSSSGKRDELLEATCASFEA
eukprot:5685632-Alexandrium_andersonii.AAC.1